MAVERSLGGVEKLLMFQVILKFATKTQVLMNKYNCEITIARFG